MKLSLKNIEGKNVGKIAVPGNFLGSNRNNSAVRQAVLAELANLRQGTHSSKNRSAVRGGGKKPWKQKVEVLRALELLDLLFGEEEELFLVQVLINIGIRFPKN